jgi:hypothetical protein
MLRVLISSSGTIVTPTMLGPLDGANQQTNRTVFIILPDNGALIY